MRDNTLILVLSDNGASQEGGPLGFVNAMGPYNFRPEPIAEKLRADRRHRRAGHPQQFSARLGDGLQHAAAPLQAEHPWRRHPRSPGDDVAEADAGEGRTAPSVRACLRPRADAARARRHRRRRQTIAGRRADADRGREFRALRLPIPPRRKIVAAIFRDVRPSRPLARAAGRRSPTIRRARRSRTTNGSCFISTAISPRSMTSRRRSPDASPT